ncbi:MAG TPA: hypothetical protein VD788_17025, partial [Candidatus Polarisedimenticolaceae bacterium]|nr:hypothetical protein [Candidatus Polarisedimenticolaceae bacterium]
MSHPEAGRLERFDQLGPTERREIAVHVASCSACRLRLLAAEPTHLFSLLGDGGIPAGALDRLAVSLGDEIDRQDRRGRRVGPLWGSIAASLLLGALIGVYLSSRPAGT